MDAKVKAIEQSAQIGQKCVYRYGQLVLLVIAAGAIYPVLYLRQIYQSSMLVALGIDNQQLGYLYSGLGTAFMLSYLPSGWLADRIAAAPSDQHFAAGYRPVGAVVRHVCQAFAILMTDFFWFRHHNRTYILGCVAEAREDACQQKMSRGAFSACSMAGEGWSKRR